MLTDGSLALPELLDCVLEVAQCDLAAVCAVDASFAERPRNELFRGVCLTARRPCSSTSDSAQRTSIDIVQPSASGRYTSLGL